MALTNTEKILLDVCRGRTERLESSSWREVWALAHSHEVDPWVAHQCRRTPRRLGSTPIWSEEFASEIERTYTLTVIQQGLQEAETQSVFSALGDIPALLLKGQAISRSCYPPGGRLERDIDIHVRPADYPKARSALVGLGYTVAPGIDEEVQFSQTKDVGFSREDEMGRSWSVEVHWRLTEPGLPTTLSSIWEHATVLTLGEAEVPVPRLEHSLMLLALNLRKHRFARLKTVLDIGRVLEIHGQSLDWEFVHSEAHAAGFCGLLRHSVRLSAELLEMNGPHLPLCSYRRGKLPSGAYLATNILPRVAGPDTVFCEVGSKEAKLASGLIPFVSLDKLRNSLHLAYERLKQSPEMATYYRTQGAMGASDAYNTRVQFWVDTARRLRRAAVVLMPRFTRATGPRNSGSKAAT